MHCSRTTRFGVRIAAAYARLRLGPSQSELDTLTQALRFHVRSVPLYAADLLGNLVDSNLADSDLDASAVLPALQQAARHSDDRIKNVAARVIGKIGEAGQPSFPPVRFGPAWFGLDRIATP